eukprot:g18648.t1
MGAWLGKVMQWVQTRGGRGAAWRRVALDVAEDVEALSSELSGVSTCQDEMCRNHTALVDRVKKLEDKHLLRMPNEHYVWHVDNNPLTKDLDAERKERLGLLHRVQDLELQALEIPHLKKLVKKLYLYVDPDMDRIVGDDPYPWWDGNKSEWSPSEVGGGRLDLNDLDLYGDEDLLLEEEDDLLAEEDLASDDELDGLFRTPSEDDEAEVLSGAGASASGGPAGNSLGPGTVSDNNIGEATAAVGGASGSSQLAAGSVQVKQEAEASAEVDPDDI